MGKHNFKMMEHIAQEIEMENERWSVLSHTAFEHNHLFALDRQTHTISFTQTAPAPDIHDYYNNGNRKYE